MEDTTAWVKGEEVVEATRVYEDDILVERRKWCRSMRVDGESSGQSPMLRVLVQYTLEEDVGYLCI